MRVRHDCCNKNRINFGSLKFLIVFCYSFYDSIHLAHGFIHIMLLPKQYRYFWGSETIYEDECDRYNQKITVRSMETIDDKVYQSCKMRFINSFSFFSSFFHQYFAEDYNFIFIHLIVFVHTYVAVK